jgi:heme O synthase-like polyprenyltransferase
MTTAPPNFQPNVSTAAAARAVSGVRGTFGALGELVKPSIAGLVMVTATCGALVSPEPIRWGKLLVALVSTAMVVGAANALNMYAERDSDALMSRTRHRPLPSGRLSPEIALAFALVLASLGLNVLGLSSGGLPCLLTALAFGSYVLVYTPLKRVTPYALHVGALPGAIPPLIGYAAVNGELGAAAWWLFAILFVWQLPHFLAIALFRSADYARAGAARRSGKRVLAGCDPDRSSVSRARVRRALARHGSLGQARVLRFDAVSRVRLRGVRRRCALSRDSARSAAVARP